MRLPCLDHDRTMWLLLIWQHRPINGLLAGTNDAKPSSIITILSDYSFFGGISFGFLACTIIR